ncbi:collagen-binding domain-containing protein [Vagococcus fluvialis]|uniref:collagen-binding domain-containing protein n=1 Tax=Vagococcus fluvialis TaxID=2738 RepID=UPI001D09D34C|nr:collagen-binding domain-containing protein [Vagococcus fluvialis]UDM80575.1 isopeptide-forming domain-containing fimbrial protein [Vagococcus fluvialis]
MFKKKFSSLVSVVMLLVGTVISPLTVFSSGLTDDGVSQNYRDYNGIIFNDHTFYTADVEGSAAVGGNIIAEGGFSYAASAGGAHVLMGQPSLYPNTPGLVLKGDFNFKSPALVILAGGDFVYTNNYTESVKLDIRDDSQKKLWSQEKMDSLFTTFKNDINNEISNLESFVTSQTEDKLHYAQKQWESEFSLYVSERNEKVLFADMSNQNHDLKEIRIPNIDDYDHVVIYSNQSAIRFANGSIALDGKPIDTGKPQNQELYDLAGKLTWVLPNMTDIKISGYGMIGDIYAPNATVDTKGGSVNGSLYVNNLISNGGFEVHNFSSKPVIPEKPEVTEPSTTEPSTTEPSTTEPSTTEPSATEPSTTEPSTTEPSTTEPSTTEPSTTEPSTTEPSTTEPSTTEPSTTEPSTTEPSTTEPSTTEPSTTEPSTTEPSTTEPSTTEPSTTEPSTTEPSTTEPTDPVEPIEPRMGEFRATKVVDKKEAKLGDILTYTITAENIVKDSILTNVVISDDLPAGLSLVKDSVEVEIDGKRVEFDKDKIETIGNKAKVTFKELKGGQKISISLKAKVTDKAVENIVNIALVEGENPEKTGEPVEPAKPKEEVPVKPKEPEVPTTKVGKLEANKVADKKQVKVGEKLTYTIAAKNVVPESKLSKVIITDELPESLDLVEGSLLVKVNGQEFKINQEDIEINGNHIKVTFKNVIGNQEIEISFQAAVNEKAKDSVLNTALIEGEDEEPTRPVEPVTPEVEVPVVPEEKEEPEVPTKPEEKEKTPKTPGKPNERNPKEPQNPQGKPATKNSQFLPKTGEYLNSNASIIQGLTFILGAMYLLVMRRKMKSNELE